MSTPDRGVLTTRLAVMSDLLAFLADLPGVCGQTLREDLRLRLAVERALCQLVDQAVDINAHIASRTMRRPPQTQRESFDLAVRAGYLPADLATSLTPSVGMRNILVHDYVSVDLDLVAAAIPLAARDFAAYVRAISRALVSGS